jgi:hypothetical protein
MIVDAAFIVRMLIVKILEASLRQGLAIGDTSW